MLAALERIKVDRTSERLRSIMAIDDKRRFELSSDWRRICARQVTR